MFVTTEAIVLRTVTLSGGRVIMTVYSRVDGLLSLGMRVSSKKGSKALTEPLSICEFTFQQGKENVHNVKEARITRPYTGLAIDFHKRSIGMFISEVLYGSLREQEPNEEQYDFIRESLIELDGLSDFAQYHIWFMKELTKHLGLMPSYYGEQFFDLREGIGADAEPFHGQFIKGDLLLEFGDLMLADAYENRPTIASSKELLKVFVTYYRLHLDNFKTPKSLEVLEMMYDDLRN